MNENEKAKLYDSLMSQYITVENEISGIPKLTLEEQMRQVDATNKKLYSDENQIKVNTLRQKLTSIQHHAQTIQLR
jgi:hypothetical protein|tara:strand:+ start:647 stop:874 length:228 start_codon:yes stop_codon:yes gene_type:complete